MSPLELPSRIPPHNLDAERAVLGAVLLEGREALPRVVEVLRPSDFYTEAHRAIYHSMLNLFDRGEPVDLLTLQEDLRRTDQLPLVGGPAALALLVEQGSVAAYLSSYTAIVRDMAVLRELIQAATHIIGQAFEAKEDVQSLVDDAERRIFSLAERRLEGSAIPVKNILNDTFKYIERLYERQEHVTGVPTGLVRLDEMTAGLQPSDLILIAGRPSMGKTAFALSIAQHVGIKLRMKILVLSLEMSSQQLVQRMLSSEGRVDSLSVRTGRLQAQDWHRLTSAAGRLSEAPIFIDDSPGLSVLEVRAKARRMKSEHGLDLIVIDYLQLMRGRSNLDNRQQEISEISRSLKALAKELNVPVVALSQLSRAIETRGDNTPRLSDLRECVTGDTLVCLADGRRVAIRSLVGMAPDVLAISPAGKIVSAKSERVWLVGQRAVFAVKTASGRTIQATAQHRLYAGDGWRTIGQLTTGDRLAIARRLPEPQARRLESRLDGRRSNTNVDTVPIESFARVRSLMRTQGISQRRMAALRGTAYGGAAHFKFAPSRAVLGEYAEMLHDEELRATASSDLFWDRIVAIEPAGAEEVFDLTVPGPASWLADGIVSHNSGALEQDADVIMFLHRPSFYSKDAMEEEARKTAEVHIGKQRNGPTGKLEVAFISQYARFENLASGDRQFEP